MSIFTKTPVKAPKSNKFNLSHEVKLSLDAGKLVPIACVETLPGDVINYKSVVMTRLAPMLAPIMHKMDVSVSRFFVPWRLIWSNWETFMSNPIPNDDTPVKPYFEDLVIQKSTLGDYLGLPTQMSAGDNGIPFQQYNTLAKIDAGPFAAYQKVYNDYFRDENLINNGEEVPYKLTDGLNNFNDFDVLRNRAWQHDYATSCLPFAQKGQAVEIPIADFEDVPVLQNANNSDYFNAWQGTNGNGFPQDTYVGMEEQGSSVVPYNYLYAKTSELSESAAVTVNNLRWAVRLQEFLEKNARGGTRYTEIIKAHWNVTSSDARLQRAEFLGYDSNPVVISEVLQTSQTTDDGTPQGEMAGHGLSVGQSNSTNYFVEEYGFFIVLLNIRPKTAYSQGLSRMFTRWSPLDYAWPTFAHLGEQEIKKQEIYYDDRDSLNETTFGYLPRYAEYRYQNDRVAGDFRDNLIFWHMGRQFNSRPVLNGEFITCQPTKRIFAVNTPSVNNYYVQVNNILSVRRRLPRYGVPTL